MFKISHIFQIFKNIWPCERITWSLPRISEGTSASEEPLILICNNFTVELSLAISQTQCQLNTWLSVFQFSALSSTLKKALFNNILISSNTCWGYSWPFYTKVIWHCSFSILKLLMDLENMDFCLMFSSFPFWYSWAPNTDRHRDGPPWVRSQRLIEAAVHKRK